MSYPLAVIAPQIGARSETFVRRHMVDLLPGKTAAVARRLEEAGARQWETEGPSLLLKEDEEERPRGLVARAARALRPDRETRAARFLREHGVRVLMGEYLDFTWHWLRTAKRLGLPIYGHAHGADVSKRLRREEWRQRYLDYNDAAGIIAVSEHSRRRLIDLGLDGRRIHVVPCGVDVPEAPVLREEGAVVRCLAVGRMVPKKAPLITLEAFRRAAEARPELRLDYVGTGQLQEEAEAFVRRCGLEARITLHGGQPSETVLRMMREADLFLQHSIVGPETGDEEGLPVAVLEAMAHALPVVSTRHAGIPEAVADGATGFLTDEGDAEGMAERILALAADAGRRREMGLRGWEAARSRFSWERERADLLRIMGLESLAGLPAAEGAAVATVGSR